MKGIVYNKFNGPLYVRNDIPIPETPDDGILIRVICTGICRSDWHGWKGHDNDIHENKLLSRYPKVGGHIPGHEFSGIIINIGKDLKKEQQQQQEMKKNDKNDDDDYYKQQNQEQEESRVVFQSPRPQPQSLLHVGDHVVIPFILSCGNCNYCTIYNQPTICKNQEQPGFTMLGSYAQYVAIPRANRNVIRIKEDNNNNNNNNSNQQRWSNVTHLQAASLGCRFTTAYRAVIHQGQFYQEPTQQQQQRKQQQQPLPQYKNDSRLTTTKTTRLSRSIGIFGCGGVGLSCIMIAREVISSSSSSCHDTDPDDDDFIIVALDVNELSLDMAKRLGATHTINVRGMDQETVMKQLKHVLTIIPSSSSSSSSRRGGGSQSNDEKEKYGSGYKDAFDGFDVTIDAAGFASTCENAIYCTRPGGRMVQVGLPLGHPLPIIPMARIAGKEINIVGSHGFDGRTDLPVLLDMIENSARKAKKKKKTTTTTTNGSRQQQQQGQGCRHHYHGPHHHDFPFDPSLLVARCVSLEDGARALQDMDHGSPVGMTMITDFGHDDDDNNINSVHNMRQQHHQQQQQQQSRL